MCMMASDARRPEEEARAAFSEAGQGFFLLFDSPFQEHRSAGTFLPLGAIISSVSPSFDSYPDFHLKT